MSEHSQIVQNETKTALSKVEMMNLNRIKHIVYKTPGPCESKPRGSKGPAGYN